MESLRKVNAAEAESHTRGPDATNIRQPVHEALRNKPSDFIENIADQQTSKAGHAHHVVIFESRSAGCSGRPLRSMR